METLNTRPAAYPHAGPQLEEASMTATVRFYDQVIPEPALMALNASLDAFQMPDPRVDISDMFHSANNQTGPQSAQVHDVDQFDNDARHLLSQQSFELGELFDDQNSIHTATPLLRTGLATVDTSMNTNTAYMDGGWSLNQTQTAFDEPTSPPMARAGYSPFQQYSLFHDLADVTESNTRQSATDTTVHTLNAGNVEPPNISLSPVSLIEDLGSEPSPPGMHSTPVDNQAMWPNDDTLPSSWPFGYSVQSTTEPSFVPSTGDADDLHFERLPSTQILPSQQVENTEQVQYTSGSCLNEAESYFPTELGLYSHPLANSPADQQYLTSVASNGRDTLASPTRRLPPPEPGLILSRNDAELNRRDRENNFILKCRAKNMSFKAIKEAGGFPVAESTLRGRYRTLTKTKEQRVRKPHWKHHDLRLLILAVEEQIGPDVARTARTRNEVNNMSVSWKDVADFISSRGGSYHFGNATCKKKWMEIRSISASF